MRIEVNINKKYFMVVFGILLFIGLGIFLVNAYNSPYNNPAIMGHSANEIEGGVSVGDLWTSNTYGISYEGGNVGIGAAANYEPLLWVYEKDYNKNYPIAIAKFCGAGNSCLKIDAKFIDQSTYGTPVDVTTQCSWEYDDHCGKYIVGGCTDTCDGALNAAYECKPGETKTCTDYFKTVETCPKPKYRDINCNAKVHTVLDVNGPIFQRGSQVHADYVFDTNYELESIEEHEQFMWENKRLEAVSGVEYDEQGQEIVDTGEQRRGMLEELEKAHIYITQLNNKIKELTQIICKNNPSESVCN